MHLTVRDDPVQHQHNDAVPSRNIAACRLELTACIERLDSDLAQYGPQGCAVIVVSLNVHATPHVLAAMKRNVRPAQTGQWL